MYIKGVCCCMFYERLSKLCSDYKISLTALVTKELKMSVSNVTKWKDGNVPKSDTVEKIADFFDVSIDYLLGKSDTKNKPTTYKGSELSADLQELIKIYDSLSPAKKKKLLIQAQLEVDEQNSKG